MDFVHRERCQRFDKIKTIVEKKIHFFFLKKTTIQQFLNQKKRCPESKTNGNEQIEVKSCQNFVQNSSVIQCSSSMINESNSPECSICLDEFHDGEMLNVLLCSHEFHENCLEVWFSKSRSCPMCRQLIDYRLEPVTFLT